RQLALGDAVGPVGVVLERRAPEGRRERVDHERPRLPRLHAADPRCLGRRELAERRRDRARGELTKLMAADTRPVLYYGQVLALADVGRNVALTSELIGSRDLEHRVPVDRRIVARRRRLVWSRHGSEIQLLTGRAGDLRGINETVTAHPHL